MDTPASDNSPTLERIAREQQLLVDAVNALVNSMRTLEGEQQRLGKALTGMDEKLDGIRDDMDEKLDGIRDDLDKKLVGIRDDIGLVRGGHARNEMLRNAPLISDALGYEVVTELPRTALISLGKAAAADGKARSEVESFRNADAVLLGQAEDGRQGYIAVEVSFTVDGSDVRRAVRNAQYLETYTGFPSCAVVAGVDILQEAQDQVDGGKAYFYRIPRREIQAQ